MTLGWVKGQIPINFFGSVFYDGALSNISGYTHFLDVSGCSPQFRMNGPGNFLNTKGYGCMSVCKMFVLNLIKKC